MPTGPPADLRKGFDGLYGLARAELDPTDRIRPKCGGELSEMAGQFEEADVIDVGSCEFRIEQENQQKYICSCGECVETALGSDKPIPGAATC